MNLIIGSPWWLVALLMLALGAAALEDALRFRISNLTCGAVFGAALVAIAIHGFSPGLWQNAAVFAAILALGTLAFAAGWMGGGDVKLIGALALWLPWQAVLGLLVIMSLAGGALTIAMLIRKRLTRSEGVLEIPYGVAIAFGGLWLISERFLNQFG